MLNIFTWHVHGSYLWYLGHLTRLGHRIHLPVRPGRPEGYGGRAGTLPWPAQLVEVDAAELDPDRYDVVLTQSARNWTVDRHELGLAGRPTVHLEHDPPRGWPNDARHFVADPTAALVHVTPFNALMWDSPGTPTVVIEHGVCVPADASWTGTIGRGVTVVNNLARRGRRLGPDVFAAVAAQLPVDLFGMGSQDFAEGRGELPLAELHRRAAAYRFFFNPIRYTSLGLAVCEAMAVGLPVLALATTELATVVRSGVTGYAETDPARLVDHGRRLLADRDEAAALSAQARRTAATRFGLDRFLADWERVLTAAARGQQVAA